MAGGGKITISEGLSWMKTLKGRHAELVQLRNQNATKIKTEYNGQVTTTTVLYDARGLDSMIAGLAREMRILDQALKRANAQTFLGDYAQNDGVLGELSLPESK